MQRPRAKIRRICGLSTRGQREVDERSSRGLGEVEKETRKRAKMHNVKQLQCRERTSHGNDAFAVTTATSALSLPERSVERQTVSGRPRQRF